MAFSRLTAGLVVAAIIGPLALAQPDLSAVEFDVQDLGGGVYMLGGGGGNVGLAVGDDGAILIDDGYTPLGDKLLAKVADIAGQPVRYVINTHWHFDHVGANELVGSEGAVIVAHDNVRKRMNSEQFVKALNRKFEPSPSGALPVVTFAAELKLYLNDDEILVRHIHHAHTDGDAIIHFARANVIHAGDTFWNGFYPLIDNSSGGGIEGMIRAADAMLALADDATRIIPGHGPLADKAALVEYRDMLQTVHDRIAAMLDKGFGPRAVHQADPLKDLNDKWGQGFIKPRAFLDFVYEEMSAK